MDDLARFEVLKSKYHRTLGAKLAELDACWHECHGSKYAESCLSKLSVLAHRLAGSSGSYGYRELSDAAATLDKHIRRYRGEFDDERIEELNAVYHRLHITLSNTAFGNDQTAK